MKNIYFFLMLNFGVFTMAQNQAEPDSNFHTGSGFDTFPYTMEQQTDGKILVGGFFTIYDGTEVRRIVRLNVDGSIDSSFNIGTGFNDIVSILKIQNDGKILVGGIFTDYNGTAVNNFVRLNPDGTLDPTFNSGTGFNNVPLSIVEQNDGKIVVGGLFTSYNGTVSNEIIRLNSDGSIDSSFNIGEGFETGGSSGIYKLHLLPDGKIMASGVYTEYDGQTTKGVTRLNPNGTMDTSFYTGEPECTNSLVYTTAMDDEGKILIGGLFNSYACSPTPWNVARIKTDGMVDETFDNAGTGLSDGYESYAMAIQNDGKILIGGRFSKYDDEDVHQFVRINPDGSRDDSFDMGTGFNWDAYGIRTVIVLQDGRILIGGSFNTYNGETHNNLICLKGTSELGVEDTNSKNMNVYPNPVKNELTIENPNLDYTHLQIYELSGKMIFNQNLNTNQVKIDFSPFAKGVYILQFKSKDNQIISKKIIKN